MTLYKVKRKEAERMQKKDVLIVYGQDARQMAYDVLRAAQIEKMIPEKGARIALKPNLVGAIPAEEGATTHPALLAGVVEYLQERGFQNISIVEGSWVGDRTQAAFDACGYRALSERYGVPLIDTQKEKAYTADCHGMQLQICNCVREIDFLINMPVLKGHCQTAVTCALKNMKGLIPNGEKRRFHSMGLMKPIAHLNTAIRQDFVLVDALCGDLNFEEGGNPVERGQVLGFLDPVLCDAWACEAMGYAISDVPYITMAEALGVGSADIGSAKVTELNRPQARREGLRATRRVASLARCVRQREACSACYAGLIYALQRLEDEGIPAPKTVAIGQGWRGQGGTLGVGQCTCGFERFAPGCPPRAADIFAFLRAQAEEE